MIRVALFFLLCSLSLSAQTNNCQSEKHKEFDFWLGDWDVYNEKGKLVGTNSITKMQNGCVLQENWVSKTSSNTGTSYNYFDKQDKTWNQVWVDNSGFSLVLKGNLVNGNMILKSATINSEKGNYQNKVSWIKNADGSITQLWVLLDASGNIIKEAFKGIYKKK